MLLPSIMWTDDDDDAVLLPASYAPPFVEPNDSAILDLTVDLNKEDYQWKDGKDGYFYYLAAIDPGKSSQEIIDHVKLITANIPEALADSYNDAKMTVEVKVEAIGLSKYAFRDAFWKGNKPTSGALSEIDAVYTGIVEK